MPLFLSAEGTKWLQRLVGDAYKGKSTILSPNEYVADYGVVPPVPLAPML